MNATSEHSNPTTTSVRAPRRGRRLAALLLCLGANAAQAAPENLDGSRWLDEIEVAFADVKGYSAVLVHENGYVLQKAGGMAGPGEAMSWNHYGNIGSAQKMIATMFMLRAIEDRVGRGNVAAVGRVLDTEVFRYLPNVVQQSVPAINRQIRIRDLLQHKSGIKTEHSSGNPFNDFLVPIAQVNYDLRDYNNTNMKLLTYVSVAYARPEVLAQSNALAATFNWNATSEGLFQYIGGFYWDLVQSRLLDQAKDEVFASCHLTQHLVLERDAPVARMYWTKNDTLDSGGWYDGAIEAGHCKGQGGWYHNARMLARLYRDLGTDDGVISPALYAAMYDADGSAAARDDRLGWNREVFSAKLQSTYGWNSVPAHGGSHTVGWDGGSITARSAVMRLPGGFHAVALVNSNEMSSGDVATALKDAFVRSLP
jgi:CubicO group peptidase (beta-lactamase class C family)